MQITGPGSGNAVVTAVACQARLATTQSVSATTYTEIGADTEDLDTSSIHDNATNNHRFTAPSNGKYLFITEVAWTCSTAPQTLRAFHTIDGTRQQGAWQYQSAYDYYTTTLAGVYSLTAGQWLSLQTYGAAHNVLGSSSGANVTKWTFIRIGD